jgi:hypothetical protein
MTFWPGQSPIPGCQKDADMAGPSWLAGTFAAIMILTAAYSAGRVAVSRRRGRATELDADGLHAVMGTAMAGMLAPRLTSIFGRIIELRFGVVIVAGT